LGRNRRPPIGQCKRAEIYKKCGRRTFLMAKDSSNQQKYVIELEFNQQQDVMLKRLKEEGFGTTDLEIIRNAFMDFLRQTRF